MRCPNCGNEVPARPTCQRCGQPLFGSPSLPASALGPVTVPLTTGQRARLLAGCVPPLGLGLLVAAYLVPAAMGILPAPRPAFYLLMGVVLLVTGYYALQHLRDLLTGVALAQEDLLVRSYRSRSASGNRARGNFEQLGTMRMTPRMQTQHPDGARYRVVFSPNSKIVWALEPPDPRQWA